MKNKIYSEKAAKIMTRLLLKYTFIIGLMVAYIGPAHAQKTDAEYLVELNQTCRIWNKGMDASESQKKSFCDCVVINVTASVPSTQELDMLVNDFGIDALRKFTARPQGAQKFDMCFL